MKSRKDTPISDMLILGATLTGLYFVSQAVIGAGRQHPSPENQVVATYNADSNELVDNATDSKYVVAQETKRNTWDNLDYQVRTGNLILERIDNGGSE